MKKINEYIDFFKLKELFALNSSNSSNDYQKYFDQLQRIGEMLLKCTIKFNSCTIKPLMVEAYYYEEDGVYQDIYMDDKRNKTNYQLGYSLYLISSNSNYKNRLDITLGDKKTKHLSYLIKLAECESNGDKRILIQTEISKFYKENKKTNQFELYFNGELNIQTKTGKRIGLREKDLISSSNQLCITRSINDFDFNITAKTKALCDCKYTNRIYVNIRNNRSKINQQYIKQDY